MRVRRARVVALALVALAAAAVDLAAVRTPPGPRSLRSFDPDRMAELEVDMWQAYYRKENARLFALLATMLHEQYRYTWLRSCQAGFHLARAAARFGDARSDYERVLPDLERAYAIARAWMGASFDPAAVARAELSWWVARRVPGEDAPANVGRLIAREYALLYEAPVDRVSESAALRAEAGALRDRGGAAADWREVSRLLHASYGSLHRAVAAP